MKRPILTANKLMQHGISRGVPVLTFAAWWAIAQRLPHPPATAWAIGTRVSRNGFSDGANDQSFPEGARGTIRILLCDVPDIGMGYIVEWDQLPGVPVLVSARKLERLQ